MVTRDSKRDGLARLLEASKPGLVDLALFEELSRRLAPISAAYLRDLLRQSGIALVPLVEGVRLSSLEELERTLLGLQREYEGAAKSQQKLCRRLVIDARQRASLAAGRARDPARRAELDEMILWLRTWLENPTIFATWAALRKEVSGQ